MKKDCQKMSFKQPLHLLEYHKKIKKSNIKII